MLRPIRFQCAWSFGCQMYSPVYTHMTDHIYNPFRRATEIPEPQCRGACVWFSAPSSATATRAIDQVLFNQTILKAWTWQGYYYPLISCQQQQLNYASDN